MLTIEQRRQVNRKKRNVIPFDNKQKKKKRVNYLSESESHIE
jgi:hypothetical protein